MDYPGQDKDDIFGISSVMIANGIQVFPDNNYDKLIFQKGEEQFAFDSGWWYDLTPTKKLIFLKDLFGVK